MATSRKAAVSPPPVVAESMIAALADAEREQAQLYAQRAAIEARLAQVEPAVRVLRQLAGKEPQAPLRSRSSATGTKAVILDVLADGQRRSCGEIAAACKVKPNAIRRHLAELVTAGDVDARGSTWTRTYGMK